MKKKMLFNGLLVTMTRFKSLQCDHKISGLSLLVYCKVLHLFKDPTTSFPLEIHKTIYMKIHDQNTVLSCHSIYSLFLYTGLTHQG